MRNSRLSLLPSYSFGTLQEIDLSLRPLKTGIPLSSGARNEEMERLGPLGVLQARKARRQEMKKKKSHYFVLNP